jgi:hypothetical protein
MCFEIVKDHSACKRRHQAFALPPVCPYDVLRHSDEIRLKKSATQITKPPSRGYIFI